MQSPELEYLDEQIAPMSDVFPDAVAATTSLDAGDSYPTVTNDSLARQHIIGASSFAGDKAADLAVVGTLDSGDVCTEVVTVSLERPLPSVRGTGAIVGTIARSPDSDSDLLDADDALTVAAKAASLGPPLGTSGIMIDAASTSPAGLRLDEDTSDTGSTASVSAPLERLLVTSKVAPEASTTAPRHRLDTGDIAPSEVPTILIRQPDDSDAAAVYGDTDRGASAAGGLYVNNLRLGSHQAPTIATSGSKDGTNIAPHADSLTTAHDDANDIGDADGTGEVPGVVDVAPNFPVCPLLSVVIHADS